MARNKGADRAQRALFKFDPAQARLEAAGPGVGRVGARAPCVHHRTQNLPCAVVVAVQSRKISAIGLETRSAVVQRPVLPRRRSARFNKFASVNLLTSPCRVQPPLFKVHRLGKGHNLATPQLRSPWISA